MLTPAHNLALEACLRDVFRDLDHGIDSASQVQNIFMAIMDKSLRVARDEMLEWNAVSIAYRIPLDVLVSCLHFLPAGDLLGVSRVSRYWRSVALAFPALWADIRLTSAHSHTPDLLRLFLTRAGGCPVDFAYISKRNTVPRSDGLNITLGQHMLLLYQSDYMEVPCSSCQYDEVNVVLSGHMHHIRSIDWPGSIETTCFSQPAPILEILRCRWDNPAYLRDNFLGGAAGRLRRLHLHSPDFLCSRHPALRTVTHLRITSLPSDVSIGACVAHIPEQFPAVRHLHLTNVGHTEISGPAPQSLESLVLESNWIVFDPSFVVDDQGDDRLRLIEARVRKVWIGGFESLIRHVHTLHVSLTPHAMVFRGSVITTAGSTRCVVLEVKAAPEVDVEREIADFLQEMLGAPSLKSLSLPLRIWAHLLMCPVMLLALCDVTLRSSGYDEYCALSIDLDETKLQTPALRWIVVDVSQAENVDELAVSPKLRTCQHIGRDPHHPTHDHGHDIAVTLRYRSEDPKAQDWLESEPLEDCMAD